MFFVIWTIGQCNCLKDILGIMINTLFFAYISEFMALFIYFSELKYSIATIFIIKNIYNS